MDPVEPNSMLAEKHNLEETSRREVDAFIGGNSKTPDGPAVVEVQEKADSGKEKKNDSEGDGISLAAYFRVWGYAEPIDYGLRAIGFVAACGAGAALPLMTVVFGSLVNNFNDFGAGSTTPSELYNSISKNALWFLYLFITKFTCVFVHATCFTLTAIRATKALRRDFIRALVRQDIAYFDSCSPGSVATTISTNADMVENGMGEKVGVAFQALSMLTSAFVVAFIRQWKLTLVTATVMPAAVTVVGITVALDTKLEAKILKIYAKAGGLAEEAMGSVKIVTAFDAARKLTKKYDAHLDEAKTFGLKKGPILGVQYSFEFFTMYCAYALAFFYGIRLLVRGELSSGGQVLTVLLSVLLSTSSLTMLAPSIGEFSKASAAAKGMFEMIDRPSKIDPLANEGLRPERTDGTVSLHNVSFAYPSRPSVRVLDDVSLHFEPGKTTAIVGASGSGKSTIIGLIERWFDPGSGAVKVGGHDIRELNVQWLRGQLGFVQQEPVLFSDTIYNNVVHGLFGTALDDLPEVQKRDLVRRACVQAFADDFIEELPEKYDTKVGDKGGFLSGGQKQRVAIARSIISNPKILLLDEATSALDPTAEGKVQAALNNVSKDRTTIMIAHKLSTVQKADKIIVINRGKAIESGSHQELLATRGAYFALVNAQSLNAQQQGHAGEEAAIEEGSDYEDGNNNPLQKETTRTSLYTIKTEIQETDVSRKWSLARCVAFVLKEQRHIWYFFVAGLVASVGAGGVFPAQAVVFSRSFVVFQLPVGSVMERRGNFWALMYFVMSLGVLVSYASIGLFFTLSAFHATRFYRSEYFKSMLRQDIAFFDIDGHTAGEMTSRLSTHPQRLQDLISLNLGLIIIVIINLFGSCILAFAVGWRLALVAIFGCLPALFFAGFMRMRLEMSSQDRTSKVYHESARFASEAVGAIRTVSSLTMEQKVLQNYNSRLNSTVKKDMRRTILSMFLFALSDSLDLGASGLAFWYGGKLLSEGRYDTQTFFLVFIAVIFGGQAAGFLFGFTLNTTKAHAAANNIIHLRKSQPPINTSTGVEERVENHEVAVEFRNVRFSYPTRPSVPVLRNLNLRIRKGQSVGIVGASGCGKTTVIALLERFYDIDAGELLVDGCQLRDLDVRFHRSRIGMVSQDTTLYQGSIRDNVLLGLPMDPEDATATAEHEQRVVRACKDANIHDFITSLPDGYETDVGTRGLALSGGQRQRLAIARALIRDPEILLFDEATSALDTANEIVVQEAIEAAAKGPGRTTVAVAHRLSTIKRCDRIFVLHAGQVVEEGTHAELFARRGSYYNMVLSQSLDREVS